MKYILTFTMALVLLACKTQTAGLLSPTDFNKQIASADAKIVDVRTPEEFKEGYIKGAVNIDWYAGDFQTSISQYGKEQKIYLYCKSGARSGSALDLLKKLGYKNVYSLSGGITSWKSAQLPVETASIAQPAVEKVEQEKQVDFKTAIYGDKLVFVDFNATWCGPCKRMQPFVDIIKEERSSEVLVYSIDTDQEVELAKEYQIYNLPTVILLKKGAVLYRQEGYHDQKALNDLVTKYK